MITDQAKAAYIKAKKNLEEVVASFDPTQPGAREALSRAHKELKSADEKLIDAFFAELKAETGR